MSRLRTRPQPGFFMRKSLTIIILLLVSVMSLHAQTPVEDVILNYEGAKGARSFIAQGVRMALARQLMKATQVAPVASDVDRLYVLKMDNADSDARSEFVHDLYGALADYRYYGQCPSKNGEVDVYYMSNGKDNVQELVIYNPATFSLNSLYGDFTYQQLVALDTK